MTQIRPLTAHFPECHTDVAISARLVSFVASCFVDFYLLANGRARFLCDACQQAAQFRIGYVNM